MQIERTIADIVQKLREGRFPNEQSISQGIVLRVLSDLGWDVYDTKIVWPEYSTGEGRVDFALCAPSAKPKSFVEVKQPGKAEDGVKQALEYAFHTGAQFVTLTDGQTWSFYLPAEQGSYEDRRVFKLDLFERTKQESGEILRRYLEQERVASGEALDTARKEYRNKNRRAAARQAIPAAWKEIVERGDQQLVDLLTDAVESKAGIRPDESDILSFFDGQVAEEPLKSSGAQSPPKRLKKAQVSANPGRTKTKKSTTKKTRKPARKAAHGSVPKGSGVLHGKEFSYATAKEAMVFILSELAKADPTFLHRCSQHPAFQGRKRRHVAQRASDLYPDRPDMIKFHDVLPRGWVVGINLSNRSKMRIIQGAAEVAGITFGRDIKVRL